MEGGTMEKTKETPSDTVFQTARTIASDMMDCADATAESLEDFTMVFHNIAAALGNTKKNLIQHAIPLSKRGSKERRAMRAKIRAIDDAVRVAKKLESVISLTIEDIGEITDPLSHDEETLEFLEKIMTVEPTDAELRRIEDEDKP
jgi:methyl-accepting chemotaxis protein